MMKYLKYDFWDFRNFLLRMKKQGSIFFLVLCLKTYLGLRETADWYKITFSLERTVRDKVR